MRYTSRAARRNEPGAPSLRTIASRRAKSSALYLDLERPAVTGSLHHRQFAGGPECDGQRMRNLRGAAVAEPVERAKISRRASANESTIRQGQR
jgi:hypothetical protein